MANPRMPDLDLGEKPESEELEADNQEYGTVEEREAPEVKAARLKRAQKIREDAARKARALRLKE